MNVALAVVGQPDRPLALARDLRAALARRRRSRFRTSASSHARRTSRARSPMARRRASIGWNVTAPHKERALAAADARRARTRAPSARPTCSRSAAAARQRRQHRRGRRDRAAFESRASSIRPGATATILGAGGGARAVAPALARPRRRQRVVVANRSPERALCDDARSRRPASARWARPSSCGDARLVRAAGAQRDAAGQSRPAGARPSAANAPVSSTLQYKLGRYARSSPFWRARPGSAR